MRSNKKNINKIMMIFEAIAFVSFILCVIRMDGDKHLLYMAPLGYFIITILFRSNFNNLTGNIPKLTIQILYLIRCVVLPLIYTFVPHIQLFEGKASVAENITYATLLLVYEYFIVQLVIYIYDHTRHKYRSWSYKAGFDISKIIIVGLLLFVAFVLLFMPNYGTTFKSVFELGQAEFTVAEQYNDYSVGTTDRAVRTLFSMSFQLIRVLFPAYVLLMSYRKGKGARFCAGILVISCFVQLLFLTATFAEAIVSCFALILFYTKLFPEKNRKTLVLLCICSVGLLVIYFAVRFYVKTELGMYSKNSGAMVYIAQIINAYFSGIDNVAAVFNVPSGYTAEALRADLVGAIPFNTTLFGNSGHKFQYFFNLYNRSYGQIPPSISTGYYYFGPILAPLFSGIFVYWSMKYSALANNTKASLKYIAYTFCSIVFALGACMYSPAITLQWFFSWGLIMIVITHFTRDR